MSTLHSRSNFKFMLEVFDKEMLAGLKNMSSSGMKKFYRQKKKGGVTKASSTSKKKTQQYTGGASVGAPDTAQTSALVSHGSWDLKGTCHLPRDHKSNLL